MTWDLVLLRMRGKDTTRPCLPTARREVARHTPCWGRIKIKVTIYSTSQLQIYRNGHHLRYLSINKNIIVKYQTFASNIFVHDDGINPQ